jgi:hypothetical protein
MTTPRKSRNISRIIIGGQKGWQVRITRGQEQFYPYFSDSKFGGARGALTAAKEARDRIERDNPRLTSRERGARIQLGKTAAKRPSPRK